MIRRHHAANSRPHFVILAVSALIAATGSPGKVVEAQEASDGGAPVGGLTPDQIRTVIERNIRQVEGCYEELLRRIPDAHGRVTIAYVVQPDGTVRDATVVDNSFGDPAVGECIARRAGTWVYPRPDPAGEVSVRFPFNLAVDPAPPPPPPAPTCDREPPGGLTVWTRFPKVLPPHLPTSVSTDSVETLGSAVDVASSRLESMQAS